MDFRQLIDDPEEAIRIAADAQQRRFLSSVRVVVAQDSEDGHTVVLQPVIKANVVGQDGTVSQVSLPTLLDVPIHYAGGGGTSRTHMVKKGDEGMALIASHPIDIWHQQGGVQMQVDGRMHHLSDANFIPGGRSDPRKLANVSTVSDQTRSDDGKHTIDHHPTNGTHIKTVDPSDTSSNPFANATKFFEGIFHPTDGIAHNATDGSTTHAVTNTHDAGPLLSAANGAHTVNAHPTNGVGIVSTIAHMISAPNATLDKPGNFSAKQNITSTSGNISAPSGLISALSGAFSSLSAGSGGMSSSGSASFGSVAATAGVSGATVQTVAAYTVATLPLATMALQGTRAFVTDATTPTFLAALVGGGTKVCPAFCDGSRWVAA